MVHLTFDFFILTQIRLIFTKKVLHLASSKKVRDFATRKWPILIIRFPHEFLDSSKVTILILKSLLDQSFNWSSEDCCFVEFFIHFKPKTDKPLRTKTSKPNFVTFFVYFGRACLVICEFSLFVTVANQEAILLVNYASLASLARRNWRWISE